MPGISKFYFDGHYALCFQIFGIALCSTNEWNFEIDQQQYAKGYR